MKNLFIILSLTIFSACGIIGSTKTNGGAEITATRISIDYLNESLNGKIQTLSQSLYLVEYLKNQNLNIEEYGVRLSRLKDRWPYDMHPLASLDFQDISISGNYGKAYFQRKRRGNVSFPRIEVEIEWTGGSWSIVDDNFLGKGEIYDTFK